MQRVLLFTEVEAIAKRTESTAALQNITRSIDLHIHGIGFSLVNNEIGVAILYLGVTSSGIIWESRKPNKKRYKELTIHESELIEAEYQRYLVHKAVKDVQTYVLDNKFPVCATTFYIYIWSHDPCFLVDQLWHNDACQARGAAFASQLLSSHLGVNEIITVPKSIACEN